MPTYIPTKNATIEATKITAEQLLIPTEKAQCGCVPHQKNQYGMHGNNGSFKKNYRRRVVRGGERGQGGRQCEGYWQAMKPEKAGNQCFYQKRRNFIIRIIASPLVVTLSNGIPLKSVTTHLQITCVWLHLKKMGGIC